MGDKHTKLVSAIIVYCMLSASLFGLITIGLSNNNAAAGGAPGHEDVFVGRDWPTSYLPFTGTASLTANLTVQAGGTVIIKDCVFKAVQTYNPTSNFEGPSVMIYTITVEDGGKLIIDNSLVTIDQVYPSQAFPGLGIIVRNGGSLLVEDSTLAFPGHIVIDDAQLVMRNSTVEAYQGSTSAVDPAYFPADYFNDAPVMLFMSSDVQIFDSDLTDTFKLTDPDSYPQLYNFDYPFASDTSSRSLVTYTLQRNVNANLVGSGTNAPGEAAINLTMEDSKFFAVGPGESFTVNGFDIAGMTFMLNDIESITLKMSYEAPTPFDEGSTPNELSYTQPLGQTNYNTTLTTTKTYQAYDPSGTLYEATKSYTSFPKMSSADLALTQVNFTNSKASPVYINRIWVEIDLKLPTYGNISLAGNTSFTAVNTNMDLNYLDYSTTYNKLTCYGQSAAYLYGCIQDGQGAPDGLSPFIPKESVIQITPISTGPSDNTGDNLVNLVSNNSVYYSINNGQVLNVDEFNTNGLTGSISNVVLKVAYRTDVDFTNPPNYVTWNLEGELPQNSNILIQNRQGANAERSFNLYNEGVDTIEEISKLSITYTNNGGVQVLVDKLWLEITLQPSCNVYRWANLTVVDSQGIPVDGAKIDVLTASNATAYYLTADGVSMTPPTSVLDYLGRNSGDFNYTDPFGNAMIPVLTDIITAKTLPLGEKINGYNMMVTYVNVTGVEFNNSTSATFAAFPNLITQQDDESIALDKLVLEKPDLVPMNIGYMPVKIYHNETNAVLNVTVMNTGNTAAQNILVQFTDYYGAMDQSVTIKNWTEPSLLPGESKNVTVQWYTTTEAGTHYITVKVDPDNLITESDNDNNQITKAIDILPLLPDLTVANDNIYFSDNPASTGSPLTINANVKNTEGKASAVGASVVFYLGKPEAGVIIGTQTINVDPGAERNASLTWVPSSVGQFSIYVKVGGVAEYNYDNNQAYNNITVLVGGNTWTLSGNTKFTINSFTNISKNVVVKDNATLILNATLFIHQGQNANQYWLVVQDDAKLMMDLNGTVQSNLALTVYLTNSANLTIDEGGLSPANPVVIIMDGQSEVHITDSIISYDFIAPSSSEAILTAVNVNFTRSWSYFGGMAHADLTSVSIPDLVASEDAVIRHYRWINVVAYDITEHNQLETVYVQLDQLGTNSPPYSLYAAGMTDSNGSIVFKALCDEITADEPQKYYGNYRVNGTYWLNSTISFTSKDLSRYAISLPFYSPPLQMDDTEVALIIPLSLPNLAIEAGGVTVTPSEVVTNSTTSITAKVWNYGNVDAQDINVSFYLNTTSGNVLIASQIVGEIPVMQYADVSIPWTPNHPGNANIMVIVDPNDQINETTKINNVVSLQLIVLDVPRLYCNGLVFHKVVGGDTVTQVFVGTQILLDANVKNIGQSTAHDFEVIYRIDNATTGQEIDRVFVLSLAPNETVTISGFWQVTSDPEIGLFQNRTIYVSFSDFTKTGDVPASQTLYVVDNRPDLLATDANIWKGNQPVSNASLGEKVFIAFTLTNEGLTDANNAVVYLSLVNDDADFAIYNFTTSLMSGESKDFNISWVVNGVGISSYNLSINPTMLDDANPGNNELLEPFDVVLLGQPVFDISTSSDDVKPGSSLFVFGSVTSPDGMPLVNTTMSLYLADSAGVPVSPLVPIVTDGTGAFSGSITIPSEASGDVFVTLKIENGDQPRYGNKEINLQSDSGSDIPWWMILAIIAAVAAVIIIFVAYMYKHSLGKMVECGECGALIPEDSKRCPKCGVVFETGTAKCSECGAWIPSNASECPECHAKFLTEPSQEEQGDAYMKAMQEQYDEYVNTYREQAKAALGAKYSEDKFQEWLKTEPGFLTFDAWLAKREEDKKSGAFACPTCGILNPRGSTVCHKCGMVFANAPVAEVKEQPRTFRRIVKRSDKSPPKEEPKADEKK